MEDTVATGASVAAAVEPMVCVSMKVSLEIRNGIWWVYNRAEQLTKKKRFSSDQFQRFWPMTIWPVALGEVLPMKEHVSGCKTPSSLARA